MVIEKLEKNFAKFIYELETEDRLVRVGLKDKLESAKIYAKYQDLFAKENLEAIGKVISTTKSKTEKEILERIYFAMASSFIGHKTAALEDSIKTFFANATAKVGNETLAYYQIAPRISKENIFSKRESWDDAAAKIATKENPKQEKLLGDEVGLIIKFGFNGYLDYFSKSKNLNYADFNKIVGKLLASTDKIWTQVMARASWEVFKKPFKNIRTCHMSYLRSMSMFDNFYPKEKVIPIFTKFVQDIGLDDLLKNVKIDDALRPKKNPRAVCYWPDPPREVHLVIKPMGGEQDFEAVFHEGGHALHGAAVSENLPFAFRVLSRSNALTETYAFILEDLVFDPLWLSGYLNVSAFSSERIRRQAYFVNLMMLRRYLGKFSYEYQLFCGMKLALGPALYVKNLKSATGFIPRAENWLSDMDGGFYSADYLRAWIAAAQIKDYLRRKFGIKWFTDKKAGEFFRGLYETGVRDELEDVVKRLGYKSFDASLLINSYKKVLL